MNKEIAGLKKAPGRVITGTTLIAFIITSILWFSGFDKRIEENRHELDYIKQMQKRDREESREYDKNLNAALSRIDGKLDRLIEGKSRDR